MKIGFVLFDGMTSMDFARFYEAITWLAILKAKENVTWAFCADKLEVTDDRGLKMKANEVLPDLGRFDLVFLPGGISTRKLRYDENFMGWIQTADTAFYKVSVCTGALLLGEAGFLNGKKATTNSSAYELLTPYCAEVIKARVVRDGNIITAGGVTSSIDLGLYMVEMLTNSEIALQVQRKMEYPYYQVGNLSDTYM
ncbi:DJ-1/PfpI family protein [Halalkalibacter sp. APA_J-10(15)]|uniref:DJ-1/PfpI family protein n=1 Tax=Halalkalibacter sp. APA_J-10(15) TaxID=2933805 RepID=UPI001FF6AE0B|nr:DJ-1/PfpI family protein [Halalkalibacter sp. APA_J-10(15)]MCK0473975.1 DJ-1/PfpI family protein [Halalkalibacter sp. APA_J-10(15)]